MAVTIKRVEDLVCWQLGIELRDRTVAITDRQAIARDFKFCTQLREAARSVPANIAEGFGRSPRQFYSYLEIAIGSVQEWETRFSDSVIVGTLPWSEYQEMRTLAKRTRVATIRLAAYLRRRF